MNATAVCPVLSRQSNRSVAGLDIPAGEHLIAAYGGRSNGPTLIVVAGLHGNEPAGVTAIRRIAPILERIRDRIQGRVYFLAGNTRALRQGVRFIDRDLNRSWTRKDLDVTGTREFEATAEGRELTELDRLLDRILVTAEDEVYVLDLHSTSAGGRPFATVGDTMRNRRFAMKLPVRILLGIEEQLDGTMLEYLNNAGAVTMGFEGGGHDDPSTVDNHAAIVWLALTASGVMAAGDVPDVDQHKRLLAAGVAHHPIVEVRYREAIQPRGGFVMGPGFKNFDPVKAGQVLAANETGDIRSPENGLILMPLYQKLGEDGFFIGRSVSPFWLWLSGVLRELKLPNVVHLLPGVKRDPRSPETLIVNTHVARLFPLQVFHLLGFRKRRWVGRKLVVSRRRHDTDSPFARAKYGR